MSTRKPSPPNRSLRPVTEDLESRKLLSTTVSGTDIDGDTWTLRLVGGPGSLSVTKQPGPDGNPNPLNSTTEINEILIGGPDPLATRLIGTVEKGPTGDGKVFFESLRSLPSRSLRFPGALGMLGINMPHFWLGRTTPTGSTPPAAPSITIPEGVPTLKFGGVDTTHNQVASPAAGTTGDQYQVTLGLPEYGGTRIIIDQSIASTQQVPSTTAGGQPSTIQHAVVFAVAGRLELFQANEIIGDAANPPGQFADQVANASGTGGTIVNSGTAGTAPFLSSFPQLNGGGITGQIGNLRIGGNATNLTALVTDGTGQGNAKLTNFSVGGETNHVMIVAPNGLKNAVFGKGMDNTIILTHVINTLQANRGAINSSVTVDRTISQAVFGGDVIDTQVLTGYAQNFGNILSSVTGVDPSTGSATGLPQPPPAALNAQTAGGMTVRVAGDIENSVFTASVEPFNGTFGDPNQLFLPTGEIAAKVEGIIDNSLETPNQPNTAFYANQVHLNNGPVIPPNVPSPPYPGPRRPTHAPGLRNPLMIPQLKGLPTLPPKRHFFTGGVATPRGPRGNRKT